MKYLIITLSLLAFGVSCSTPEEKYKERQAEAQEDYNEDLKQAQEDFQDNRKEEAKEYIEESDGVKIKRDESRIDVVE